MKDMGEDLREMARSRERMCVSVYRVYTRKSRVILRQTGEREVTNLGISIPSHFVSLKDEHIQQSCLPMMQISNHGDVPDELWERGHIQEEALIESCLWHVFLFHDPFPGLDWSYNGLRKGLGVFFMDESLDILAIHVGCGWVILLVLMEDYSVVNGFCDCRGVISATRWAPRVEQNA